VYYVKVKVVKECKVIEKLNNKLIEVSGVKDFRLV
jgi:hypothetical protein